MDGLHHRNDSTGLLTAVVASVHDAGPGDGSSKAVLTDLATAEQDAVDAENPEIVQRLNDANVFGLCRIICGGRHQQEGVMKMSNLRAMPSEKLSQLAKRSVAPNGT